MKFSRESYPLMTDEEFEEFKVTSVKKQALKLKLLDDISESELCMYDVDDVLKSVAILLQRHTPAIPDLKVIQQKLE